MARPHGHPDRQSSLFLAKTPQCGQGLALVYLPHVPEVPSLVRGTPHHFPTRQPSRAIEAVVKQFSKFPRIIITGRTAPVTYRAYIIVVGSLNSAGEIATLSRTAYTVDLPVTACDGNVCQHIAVNHVTTAVAAHDTPNISARSTDNRAGHGTLLDCSSSTTTDATCIHAALYTSRHPA